MPESMEAQPSSAVIPGTEDPVQGQQGNDSPGAVDTQGQGQEGTQGQPGTPAATWNPQEWGMTYKGQQVFPKDRQHLVNLAQQGWGYSQSMEQLKREKAEIEASKGQYSKYDALEKALTQNPQLANSI